MWLVITLRAHGSLSCFHVFNYFAYVTEHERSNREQSGVRERGERRENIVEREESGEKKLERTDSLVRAISPGLSLSAAGAPCLNINNHLNLPNICRSHHVPQLYRDVIAIAPPSQPEATEPSAEAAEAAEATVTQSRGSNFTHSLQHRESRRNTAFRSPHSLTLSERRLHK